MADLDSTRLASSEASIDEIEQATGGPLAPDRRFKAHPIGTLNEIECLHAQLADAIKAIDQLHDERRRLQDEVLARRSAAERWLVAGVEDRIGLHAALVEWAILVASGVSRLHRRRRGASRFDEG